MPKVQPKTDKFTEFVKKLGPSLYKKLAQRGVQNVDSVYDNMMRQLAYESMYGTSRVAREQHNYGGYGWNGKTYTTFDSDDAFLDHYLDIMTGRHKDSLLASDPRSFATALKKSGYYEDSVDNYTRNLAGMQSLSRAARSHRLSNPELYSDTAEPIVQPDPIIAQPDAVRVNPVIPQEETHARWEGAEDVSPYLTGRPMVKLQPRTEIPRLVDALWDSQWEPQFQPLNVQGFKDGKLPGFKNGYKYSWNSDTQSWDRYTGDAMGQAFNDIVVTPSRNRERFNYEKEPSTLRNPNAESDAEYTKRRIEETTKNSTLIADAINLGVGFVPGVGNARDAVTMADAINKKNYEQAAMLGVALLLPSALKGPISKYIVRNLRHTPIGRWTGLYKPTRYTQDEWDNIVRNSSEFIQQPNQDYIDQFDVIVNNLYKQDILPIVGGSKEAKQVLLENPEYQKHLQQILGKNILNDYDVLNPNNISAFVRRQGTSLRGVTAKDQDEAVRFLTESGGRTRKGGDMLNTHGGVYTTNSYSVVDKFKNPVGDGVEDGYVAKLFHDYGIDPTLSPVDQLRQLRNAVAVIGVDNPLYRIKPKRIQTNGPQLIKNGDNYPYKAYVKESRDNAQSFTSEYGAGDQLAHLPSKDGTPSSVAEIEDLQYFPSQTDAHGRWQYGENKQDVTPEDLFIGKMLSPYDISQYRRFVSEPIKATDRELANATAKQLKQRQAKQLELYDKMRTRQKELKQNIKIPTIYAGLGFGSAAGLGVALTQEHKREEFRKSELYSKAVNESDGDWDKFSELYDKYYDQWISEKLKRKKK